jgi:alanine racemase
MHTRPIWAEISRSRLLANYEKLRSLAGPETELLAVVKANAYGHRADLCAPWLADAGATWLGVTSVEEAIAVRAICPQARILVMCGLWPGEEDALAEHHLVPAVWELQHIALLARAAERHRLPAGGLPVHLEIDTGMSRQGVAATPEALTPVLDRIRATSALQLEGVFTHFASADELDAAQNRSQLEQFTQALEIIAAAGLHPTYVHAANSATLLGQRMQAPLAKLARQHQARLLARPGLALYGYTLPFLQPNGTPQPAPVPETELQPVLHWKARITALRRVEAGARVGYNATFTAPRSMQLALLPVGYADGLSRKLSSRAVGTSSNSEDSCGASHVLVRGVRAPIVGRVSMDLTTVDVSGVPGVSAGDEVVLIGEQTAPNGNIVRLTADDHARWAGTIPYEVLCAISARVPRLAVE